ncbi:MAG: hypothetical protein ACYCTB_10070 [bacterium]
MKDIKEIKSKIDPVILHTMPFLPTHNRLKNYQITRSWGDDVLTMQAFETLNAHDLLTLLQMLKDYIQNRSEWLKTGETLENKPILRRSVNIKQYVVERGIRNQKENREVIWKSIKRLSNVLLTLINNKKGTEIITRYIFEAKSDNNYKTGEVLVNELFFNFCVEKGLIVNIGRLFLYKQNITILLDVFIASTNFTKYKEEDLFERTGLNNTDMELRKKRLSLKNTFKELNRHQSKYQFNYNKVEKSWIRKNTVATDKNTVATDKNTVATDKPARNHYRRKGLISI